MMPFDTNMSINPVVFFQIKAVAPPDQYPNFFEFGSGNASIEFVKAGYNVVSVEDMKEWVGKHPGVNYVHAPLSKGPKEQAWYDPKIVKPYLQKQHDIWLIDGPRGNRGNRALILKHIDSSVKLPRLIVIDDFGRESSKKIYNGLMKKIPEFSKKVVCTYYIRWDLNGSSDKRQAGIIVLKDKN